MPAWQRWSGIMKSYPFEEKRLAKWQPPYIIQPKYDGVRCRAIPLADNNFLLVSSEENPIFSVPHINRELAQSMPPYEYDGELYNHQMSFEEILSITSRTVNLHHSYNNMQFHIFDIVNGDSQMKRLSTLTSLQTSKINLHIAPFWVRDSLDEIMKVYDKIIKMGYEGIIVRHLMAPYVRKRSTFVMKFKPKKEDVYEIVDWKEEISKDGNPKGRLGAITCSSQSGDTFSVGTGLNDGDRQSLWDSRDHLKGKQVKVQYQHLTDRKVPRFPVFVEVVDE